MSKIKHKRSTKVRSGQGKTKRRKPHILHLHSSFNPGGKEVRSAQLMNAFGSKVEHTLVSAVPEQMEAKKLILPQIKVNYQPADFPSLQGKPKPRRLHKVAQALKPFDLILTYNWGSMDAVMGHTLFAEVLGLPPLIHHEDGFNEDEAVKLKTKRNWFRRIALGKSSGLVVPSETLEEIALTTWMQPMGRVKRFPNGIKTGLYAKKPKSDALPVIKRDGEHWVGTLAGLRAVKQLPSLVRAFAALPNNWQLVIVGDGPEKNAIRAEAERLEISHRVHLPGFVAKPEKYVGLFDVFALSSKSEQFPISMIEAMAAGVPVASPAVGDVASMIADENAPFITPANDESALSDALIQLSENPELRAKIGAANQAKACAEFDEAVMIDRYKRLYASAMEREI
ncbi:MAG: glycosyltransferase family 4 protein [Erythrobacter sp.]